MRTKLGGGYSLRPVTERDRDLIAVWIEGDPDHRDRVTPDFFLGPKPEEGEEMQQEVGQESFAIEDFNGVVSFYVKLTRTLRIDVQFGPDETRDQRDKNMDAMREGFAWLRQGASGGGIWEILFNSTNLPLVRFAERRLAFRKAPNELLHKVAASIGYTPKKKA